MVDDPRRGKDQGDTDDDGDKSAGVDAARQPAKSCGDDRENGDGTQQAGEECDDGNKTDGDGCSASCKKESTSTSTGAGGNGAGGFSYAAACFGVTPGKTFWYDGETARLANFGTRIGSTGANATAVRSSGAISMRLNSHTDSINVTT